MLRTGPRFRVEEKRDCVLVWNERDWSMPRRMVASFPAHPYDKGESAILAEICAAALNRELPGRVASDPADAPDPAESAPVMVIGVGPGAGPDETVFYSLTPAAPLPEAAAESSTKAAQEPPSPVAAPTPAPPATKPERKPMPEGWDKLKGRDKVAALSRSLFGDDSITSQEVR